ncbi:MAG: D-alanyl-D-alanine carboxypeptidase/D-alanyl-D-alanine endopeptidase [Planctomycetota bacterium]|jgi:D-alanyl-D-alanine carboxypeptidase/D-alanyl-D-alanine-endopeptidase (penicillin-binding protein 4)
MKTTRSSNRIWCGAAAVFAALAIFASAAYGENVREDITNLARRYERASGAVAGVSVRRCRTGRDVAAVRADDLFIPASNQKLLTSAYALAAMGGDFRFVTDVYVKGDDVIVVGDFDPTLGDPVIAAATGRSIYADVDRWARAIRRELGNRAVDEIILVAAGQRRPWRHPAWPEDQHHRWYAAPVCQINFANNCLWGAVQRSGDRVSVTVDPASRFIRVVNTLRAGSGQRWGLRADAAVMQITAHGTVKETSSEPLRNTVDNPPALLGRVLADRLARLGTVWQERLRSVEPSAELLTGATRVARTPRPLRAAMWRMNKHSENMAAEAVLLRAGDGTWPGSARAMAAGLVEGYGLAPQSVRVSDGSGLSAANRVSPAAMTMVLTQILRRDDWSVFLNSLSLAGHEGSVRRRLTEAPYRGRVLAKAGFIQGVQCLSGYILDDDHRPVFAYSVLVNGVPNRRGQAAKDLHDAICKRLVDAVDAE